MIAPRLFPVVLKQVWRHRTRSALTIAGVVVAMFLFVGVRAMQIAVERATRARGDEVVLVVYRENRFCPATSRLPEWYGERIERIPGVASVVPMQVVVNNCGASLDVVTFRGVPEDLMDEVSRAWTFAGGGLPEWKARSDAAVLGEALAKRRGLRVGDAFDAAGVRVVVAGIVRSEEAQDANVAFVRLAFLQRASSRGGLGVVTQFNVRVDDPGRLEAVARAIDDEFASEREPTHTRPEKAFIAQAGADLVEIVSFTRWLGLGCLAAVLGLVANSIVLSVQDRIREHAVLQTLGFRPGLIARLIVAESLVLSVAGGAIGSLAAWLVLERGNMAMFAEGLSIEVRADPSIFLTAAAISAAVGVAAGLFPAWQAGRREIASCFRAV